MRREWPSRQCTELVTEPCEDSGRNECSVPEADAVQQLCESIPEGLVDAMTCCVEKLTEWLQHSTPMLTSAALKSLIQVAATIVSLGAVLSAECTLRVAEMHLALSRASHEDDDHDARAAEFAHSALRLADGRGNPCFEARCYWILATISMKDPISAPVSLPDGAC